MFVIKKSHETTKKITEIKHCVTFYPLRIPSLFLLFVIQVGASVGGNLNLNFER